MRYNINVNSFLKKFFKVTVQPTIFLSVLNRKEALGICSMKIQNGKCGNLGENHSSQNLPFMV